MSEGSQYMRGDVVLANLPLVTDPAEQKLRPAVVIQNDVGDRFSPNLIVAAVSSQIPRRGYPTSLILRRGTTETEGTGLDHDSVVQTEIILTIPKRAVSRLIGRLNPRAMGAVDECIRVSLGLT